MSIKSLKKTPSYLACEKSQDARHGLAVKPCSKSKYEGVFREDMGRILK